MKIPHVLFRLINMVMVALLRSPLHRMFSASILAIRYIGVKSGRAYTVPARFIRAGGDVVVVTSKDTNWWPNFLPARQADVLLQGQWVLSQVHAAPDNPNRSGPIMRELWAEHPGDSAYMNVALRNGEPDPEDFGRALDAAVIITITPVE